MNARAKTALDTLTDKWQKQLSLADTQRELIVPMLRKNPAFNVYHLIV